MTTVQRAMKTQEMLKIEAILHEQRDRILDIAVQHGARNVRIFGSVVRGEAHPSSDIDFLVDLGELLSPWLPVSFIEDLEALLGAVLHK